MEERFFDNYVRINKTSQVWRVNVTGHIIQLVHQCVRCTVRGLLNNNLYFIFDNGKLVKIDINDTSTAQVYVVPDVREVKNGGSLSYDPSVIIHPDLLLLADWDKGEIFSYNVTSKQKVVHLTDLVNPFSVSFMIYNSHLYYIVCDYWNHQVLVYNSTWGLYTTLGGYGSKDGQLDTPVSAIGLPNGSIVVSDQKNNRICLFTIHGEFVRHLLTEIDRPRSMSMSLPYMWVTHDLLSSNHRLYRYNLNFTI